MKKLGEPFIQLNNKFRGQTWSTEERRHFDRLDNSEALEQFLVVFLRRQLMTNEMRKLPMSTKSKQGDGKPYKFHYYICRSIVISYR